jgi:hypothetical protein
MDSVEKNNRPSAPIFYFHGAAGSRLEPAMLDGKDLEKAGIRLIACDRFICGRKL